MVQLQLVQSWSSPGLFPVLSTGLRIPSAILSLFMDDGEIHPVAFYSWSFSPPKLNYDTHDKELLAIFCAFQQW